MNLKEFIELTINDSVDNIQESPHLIFPIYINGIELDWENISVTHYGHIEINIEKRNENAT